VVSPQELRDDRHAMITMSGYGHFVPMVVGVSRRQWIAVRVFFEL
jgi:hypothetical protein